MPRTAGGSSRRRCTHFGGLDILVNNAGLLPSYAYPGRFLDGAPPAKFWNLEDEVIQNVIDTNFVAHDRMTRYAVPHMIARGWGRIVSVTTRLSTMNRTGGSPYGASKAALEMASEIWMKDLDGTGVTVNILNPGAAVDTPGFATPEEKRVATASGRLHMMDPDKMRAPIAWLVSDATDGINGMRYDAVSWDASRPAAEQAALHGRPLGFDCSSRMRMATGGRCATTGLRPARRRPIGRAGDAGSTAGAGLFVPDRARGVGLESDPQA